MLSPEMIIYDEPTTGLDPFTGDAILELIMKVKEIYNTSSVIITHDIKCAKRTSDRMMIMKDGIIIAEGKVKIKARRSEIIRSKIIAKDGIELKARARVTVRANIERLIGGAGEQTIIARVGEGVVTTIGSAASHKAVLENPDLISQTVLSAGLDAGTAFEILSIDIADIDVGKNIGAQLQTDQAEADKKIAQAKAEERRAMAFAREQEMKAKVQEMRAKVVEAEAEIPKAMAEAFRKGNLGIMD